MLKKSHKFRNLQKAGGKNKVSKTKPTPNIKDWLKSAAPLLAAATLISAAPAGATTVSVSADGNYPGGCTSKSSKCIKYKVKDLGMIKKKLQSSWLRMTTPEEKAKMGYWDKFWLGVTEGSEHAATLHYDHDYNNYSYRSVPANFNPANPFPVATRNDLQGLYNPGAQLGKTMTEQRINTLSNPINSARLKKGRVLTNANIKRLTRSSRNARERNRQPNVKVKGKGKGRGSKGR